MPAYDVLIAGAGPAGAAAALTMARGGARVALLDRAAFPRDKPCGDLLGRAAVAQCRMLGVDLEALDAFRVRGVALRTPGGATLHGIAHHGARVPDEACLVPRLRFDAALVEMACGAGATLVCAQATGVLRGAGGAVLGVTTRAGNAPGPDLRAPLVVGADGWGSVIARALLGSAAARPAQRGIAARCYVQGVRNLHGRMRFFVERDLLPGCAWIFPLGDDRANVGLGTIVPEDAAQAMRPAARLARWLADGSSPAADLLVGARQTTAIVSWPLAIGWRPAPLAFAGALLAGDAAALISPMSGSGIAAALHSGRLAGEACLRALARGDTSRAALLSYERAVRRAFRPRYALERAAQTLLYHPERLDRMGVLAGWFPHSQAIAGDLLFNLG